MKIVLILTKIKTMEALMRNLIILSTLFLIVSCSDDDAEELGNSAPTASNISILGNSKYGEAMTVSYAYADTENNIEGESKMQWYRADDIEGTNKIKINEATSATYTPRVADIARYLLVEITPIANAGTLQGNLVTSLYTAEVTSEVRKAYSAKSSNKIVVGFYPSWKTSLLPIADIKWNNLTHVNYSFAIPENDGNLNVEDLSNTSYFVSTAHANGVKAFFSIGGGTGSEGFISLSANETLRKKFVEHVEEYAYLNNYDGIDIDWEGWTNLGTFDADETRGLFYLLKDLKNALARHNIKISMDVFPTAWGGKHYTTEMFDYVDWVNIMAYDFEGGWSSAPANHASLSNANQALDYWGNIRGLPKNKTVLGVSFYGKDFTEPSNINDNTIINRAYRDILASNTAAHLSDNIGTIYYTGVQTIKDKVVIIANNNDYLGAMIWEIAQDTPDETKSLLTMMDKVLNP